MKQPSTLDAALASLTDIQRKAAEWTDGSLLVLAGPGSGKTRVLTNRIAKLIRDTPDESFRVLALTFTNRAADEMRERVEALIPSASDRVYLGTFHSFSTEILRQHGQHLGLKTDFRIYSTDADRSEIARTAITSEYGVELGLSEKDLRFLPALQTAKAKLIKADGLAAQYPEWNDGPSFEAFYKAYDARLLELNAMDFDTLIFQAHEVFQRFPAIARHVRTVHRYWCIDECQDTNFAQYGILREMAGGDFSNAFAVADDDQIIYQWNGADYKRLDQFRSEFDASMLQIPTNFRCPPEVVECANKLIAHNLLRSKDKKPLIAAKKTDDIASAIELLNFPTSDDEASGIARHISENRSGEYSEVAILARFRNQLEPLSERLTDLGIPNVIIVRLDEFQSGQFTWLHNLLRLASRKSDDRVLARVCGEFERMFANSPTISDVQEIAETERIDFLSAWIKLAREPSTDASISLVNLADQLNLGQVDHVGFSRNVIREFELALAADTGEGDEAGINHALRDDISAWRSLSSEVQKALGTTHGLDAFLQEIDLRSKEPPADPDSVRLMTIHASKGNEFNHVYIIGMVEDQLPSFQSLKKGDQSPQFEEERRNCFVALTRTKQTLTLSYSAQSRGWSKKPSRFLSEMGLQV